MSDLTVLMTADVHGLAGRLPELRAALPTSPRAAVASPAARAFASSTPRSPGTSSCCRRGPTSGRCATITERRTIAATVPPSASCSRAPPT
jgi:hypothetical protein